MFLVILLTLVAVLSACYLLLRRSPLSHIPGPRSLPILGAFTSLDRKRLHISMHHMSKEYGPVFRLSFEGKPSVIVCDYASIYEVLVSKSADFAGRSSFYLADVITYGQSGIFRTDAGPKLHGRRKVVQKFLKQYGSGIKRIEDVTLEATDDLIKKLMDTKEEPVDVRPLLFNCVSDVMGILLTGQRFDEHLTSQISDVTRLSNVALARTLSAEIVNHFPFMRHFRNSAYKFVCDVMAARNEMLAKLFKGKTYEAGFMKHLQEMSEAEKIRFFIATPNEQKMVFMNIYLAGMATTSWTLSALVNVLSQRTDLQEKLRKESREVIGESRAPTIEDRQNMPFHMACLLEIGRYASIASLGLPHKAVRDTCLESSGHRIPIPAGTEVITALWSMHHSEELWEKPFHFDPTRFLDHTTGQLVDPSHPNRKHIMPFGAGHRVCVGEVMAMSRMFLILARLIQTFDILPESTISAQPSHDPRTMTFGIVLQPLPFKVRFKLVD